MDKNTVLDPADSISNKDELPDDTTYEFKEPVDTSQPGGKQATVVVIYPDGSKDEIPVEIRVNTDAVSHHRQQRQSQWIRM